ncbi:MAG: ATP-dependent Clp protease adapter ClpS [Microbacteriaceae bacterium]
MAGLAHADTLPEVDTVESPLRLVPWQTVVWDDPVNLMSYVSFVFQSYFGYSTEHAERLMMRVHTEGSAVVATGNREAMERHVVAMHGFGLNATLRRADEMQ